MWGESESVGKVSVGRECVGGEGGRERVSGERE